MVDGCNKLPLTNLKVKDQFLCYTNLADDGSFIFKTVPNGKYYVVADYKGQNIYFHPERIVLSINHGDVELDTHFEVTSI